MAASMLKRSWVSPLTAVSFVVVAVTGLLMLFHLRLPWLHDAHQWMGVLFALSGLFHLVLNWRPLIACCRSRAAALALALGVAFFVVAVVLPSHDGEHRGGPRGGQYLGRGHR